ncbi:MAG: glycine cleavage system aminomethyltransferase GcvT [Candidatus Sericytochromatia bacterium]
MSTDSAVQSPKRTPLYEAHLAAGARMVPFGGWDMPVRYTGDIAEHQAVREAAGLFDVSHMGEFRVTGPEAAAFVQRMVANDITKLAPRQALYTQFTRPDGGTVDDLLVYRLEDAGYMLVVNASNIAKDWDWLMSHKPDGVTLADESDDTAMVALQGPRAEAILAPMFEGPALAELKGFHWTEGQVKGLPVRVARTGYTGEDGFEIFSANADAPTLWALLLTEGAAHGLKPAGLGARDTLRLEAGLPLYGHELTDDISPVMAGFGWSVKPDKGEFLGRDVLAAQKAGQLTQKIVGLRLEGRQIAREGYAVYQGDRAVGRVVSGTFSPTLQAPIATALVESAALSNGEPLLVEIRTNKHPASIVKLPFYRRPQ